MSKKKRKKDKKRKKISGTALIPIYVCMAAYVTLSINGYMGDKGQRPPWNLQADKERFIELSRGKLVVMGRKAWESFPYYKEHQARDILVLSRDFVNHTPYECTHMQSEKELLPYISDYLNDIACTLLPLLSMGKNKDGHYEHPCINDHGNFEIIIAGGKETYEQLMFGISKIYATWVMDEEYKGDTHIDQSFFGQGLGRKGYLELLEDECFAVEKDENHSHDIQCTTTIGVKK